MKNEEKSNSKQEKIQNNFLNINNNSSNVYLYDNHFLVDKNIKKLVGKKNNYQNQYINKQLFDNNIDR